MKKNIFFLLIFILIVILLTNLSKNIFKKEDLANQNSGTPNQLSENEKIKNEAGNNDSKENAIFAFPIEDAEKRITKKYFGIFVTPQNSPVKPEKFYGYHTGTDFEIFPDEMNPQVTIMSICAGKILLKKWASGYGGVLVQACQLDGGLVTIVYGHLNLESIMKKQGETLEKKEVIGDLGKGYSSETDGERKHLHLGIHKGGEINILGYVSSKEKLSDWVDPCLYVCGR